MVTENIKNVLRKHLRRIRILYTLAEEVEAKESWVNVTRNHSFSSP
jgi:hypothetical protein